MLTKGDLTAIQRMFDSSKKETNERFDSIDKRFEGMDKRFEGMDKRFIGLFDKLQKNTEDLVELITTGFNSLEKRLLRINEQDFILNNHEKRIELIEEKKYLH